MNDHLRLMAVSPLDGRYQTKTEPLSAYFSEFALMNYRVIFEVEYLSFFMSSVLHRPVTPQLQAVLNSIKMEFDIAEALKIKKIEDTIHHDVKAIEYYLREKLAAFPELHPYIHIGLTSEDTNSCAYSLMVRNALHHVMLPKLDELIHTLCEMAVTHKATPLLARTHGQPAIPTTMGKELFNFAWRLHQERKRLVALPLEAKVSGAVGNFAALQASYPTLNWIPLTDGFLTGLGLTPNHFSTQIQQYDHLIKIFQSLQLINSILMGFSQDMWRYISDDYFTLKVVKAEVGSSTMPHKVNPIDFENGEGNVGLANALLSHFIEKLPISRLQRDLSDSTTRRNMGSAFGYSLLAYSSCISGLGKVAINTKKVEETLLDHWETVTEGIQTILRASGDTGAYETLKSFSRGKHISPESISAFVSSLSVDKKTKQRLLSLTPLTYVGLAERLVNEGVDLIKKYERNA